MIELALLLAVAGMMRVAPDGGAELAFGYLLVVGYLGARLVARVGLPKVTGYLLMGVVSGPFVLGLVTDHVATSLDLVNGIATCVLGLIGGSQLKLDRVRPVMDTLRSITLFGIAAAMCALSLLVFLMRPLLPMFDGMPLAESIVVCGLIGVALSAQSPTIVTALLSETRADGPLSRLVLATVVIADLAVLVAYTVVAAVANCVLDGHLELRETVSGVGWEVLGSLGFGVAIGALIATYLEHVRRGAATFAAIACVAVAELGGRVRLDPLLIMLAAGVYLANFSRVDAGALLRKLEPAELPVFLVFFALAGSKLDLHQLGSLLVPVAAIALARAGVLFVGCRAAAARTHADPMIAKYGWTGLVPQAGLSVVLVVVIQRNFPSFGPAAAMLLLGVVGLNQLVAPVLLRCALVRSHEVGKRAISPLPS